MEKRGNKDSIFKRIFLIAAIYDFFLGIVFFLFYTPIYNYFNIKLPENSMYLQLAAAFVIAMGVGYYFVYKNLHKNVDLAKLGIVYKLVYSSIASYFFFIGEAHFVFFIFAVCDIVFLILFFWFLSYAKEK